MAAPKEQENKQEQKKPVNEGQNRMCLGGRFNPADLTAKKNKLKKKKKSQTQAQKEKTKFAEQLCEDADDYYRLVKETYFENYYEKIKDLTFDTKYIELSKNDCKVLMQLHQEYVKWDEEQEKMKATKAAQKDNDKANDDDNSDKKQNENENKNELYGIPEIAIYDYDSKPLQTLAKAIDKIISAQSWKHIFIRMSIRPPKDSALSSLKFTQILKREYQSLKKLQGIKAPKNIISVGGDADELWNLNQKVIACYRAQTFALACDNGQEAMDLLVRSPRIQGDMESYLDGTYEQKFQLVIRNFQYFDVCFEFRSFVYKKKLTGLTQYNDLCYFDDLVKFKDDIIKKVGTFVDKNKGRIPLESFVLDIVMVDVNYNDESEWPPLSKERLDKLKVMIIEINPLAEFAGGGLFEWNKDKDVLLGEKPFEFRMQNKLSSYITADLMPAWHPFIFGNSKKLIK